MNVTCQVLTNAQQPVVGMRVRLTFQEGMASPSGLVANWKSIGLPTTSQLGANPACSVMFAVAEYAGDTPWPIIQIDLAWAWHLHHYVLLCCDGQSYSVSTSTNEYLVPVIQAPKPAGSQWADGLARMPMLSPIKDIQFMESAVTPSGCRDFSEVAGAPWGMMEDMGRKRGNGSGATS